MNRRAFLTGLLASAAIPALGPRGVYVLRHDVVAGPVYGVSPAMDALQLVRDMAELMRRMERDWYRDHPLEFVRVAKLPMVT